MKRPLGSCAVLFLLIAQGCTPAAPAGQPEPATQGKEGTVTGTPRVGDLIRVASRRPALVTPFLAKKSVAERQAYNTPYRIALLREVEEGKEGGLAVPAEVVCCVEPFSVTGAPRGVIKVRTPSGRLGWLLSDEITWEVRGRSSAKLTDADLLDADPPKTPGELAREAAEKEKAADDYREKVRVYAFREFARLYKQEMKHWEGVWQPWRDRTMGHAYRNLANSMDAVKLTGHPIRKEADRRAKVLERPRTRGEHERWVEGAKEINPELRQMLRDGP